MLSSKQVIKALLILIPLIAFSDPITLPELLKLYRQPYIILPSETSTTYITRTGQIIQAINTKTAINTPTTNALINTTEKTTQTTEEIYAVLSPLTPPESITIDIDPSQTPPLDLILKLLQPYAIFETDKNILIIRQKWKLVKNLTNQEETGEYNQLLEKALKELTQPQPPARKLVYPLLSPPDFINLCTLYKVQCHPIADAFLIQDHPALSPYIKDTKPKIYIKAYVLNLTDTARKELEINLSLNLSQAPIPQFWKGQTIITNALSLTLQAQRGILNAIELTLNALTEKSQARIITAPSLYLDDRETATIRQGFEIPIITPPTPNAPASVSYKNAYLSLSVSPQLLPNGEIKLNLTLTKDSPDFSREIGGNIPVITNALQTSLTIKPDTPYLIGGITEQTQTKTRQTPLIPIFGKREDSQQTSQLYILLYATITENPAIQEPTTQEPPKEPKPQEEPMPSDPPQ